VRDKIKLVLLASMNSHTGFRLLSKLVTLNDLERRNDRRPISAVLQLLSRHIVTADNVWKLW